VNGALQVRGQDYTATNGTSVVLTSALAVNDVVEIFAYTAFTVANAYTKSETDGVAAAAPGLRMIVPSSVAVGSGSGSANAAGFVTFSGASSISLNGCFSSTYDNYRILCTFTNSSAAGIVGIRLRSGTTDNSSSNYIYAGHETYPASGPSRVSSTGTTFFRKLYLDVNETGNFNCDLFDPFRTQFTGYISQSIRRVSSSSLGNENYSGTMTVNTSYDGFSIVSSGGGTYTGTVAVYGYKD
jgi:hypothetical protein